MKNYYFILLIFIIILSCENKTTEVENWEPVGNWNGVLNEGNNDATFEYFTFYASGFGARAEPSFIQGYEINTEEIMLSGDWIEEGDEYELTGSFSIRIFDDDGFQIYLGNGSLSGELHYDEDMPFPEGTGSGITNDGQYSISWSIYKAN